MAFGRLEALEVYGVEPHSLSSSSFFSVYFSLRGWSSAIPLHAAGFDYVESAACGYRFGHSSACGWFRLCRVRCMRLQVRLFLCMRLVSTMSSPLHAAIGSAILTISLGLNLGSSNREPRGGNNVGIPRPRPPSSLGSTSVTSMPQAFCTSLVRQ